MSQVYLASYTATSKGALGIANRVIRFFTKGPISHSELCVGNPFDGAVLCVSSDPKGGVRGKVMQLDRDRWILTAVPTIYPQQVINFLNDHKGQKYDWVGCVRSVLPFVSREHESKWFCSEVCATIIGLKDPWRFHPNALHCVMNSHK